MKYAIDYRNMHTAIHGLMLFDTSSAAFEALEELHSSNEECTLLDALESSCALVDEVDYRKLDNVMNDVPYSVNSDGFVHTLSDDITIINFGQSIDLYL